MKHKRKYSDEKVYEYDYKIIYLKPHIFEKIKKNSVDDRITISQLIEKLYNFYEEKHTEHIG